MLFRSKSKSDDKSVLLSFSAMVKTQFNACIKIIRLENAPKFNMPDFFSAHGILDQKSCAYTPQQNSVVERKHQHILSIARALKI